MYDFIERKDKVKSTTISRSLSTNKHYSSPIFNEFSQETNHLICQQILRELPFILYNDDFNDRPVSELALDDDDNEWYQIFDRVFTSTNPNYSLSDLAKNDERVTKSILSDVGNHLSTTLTDTWSRFSPEKGNISVEFVIDSGKNLLKIFIREQIKGKAFNYFAVSDRSKGFIWYYNFIMKIRYNAKQSGTSNETVFLLDEPGSYLHQTAQADLCKKLREISQKEGIVIYCTHSPQLLLPLYIPMNNIFIVEKTKNSNIKIESVSTKNKMQSKRNTAMQPIYEALQIPEYQTILEFEMIVCVEGIYDKYCIESFCNLPENVRIFPSVSAASILNNIQYFIAYQKKYFAIWDNDSEGKKELGKGKKTFGEREAENLSLLPNIYNENRVQMEDMISSEDYLKIKESLKMATTSTYEAMITELRFCNEIEKRKVLEIVSDKTKNSFHALENMIKRHFNFIS